MSHARVRLGTRRALALAQARSVASALTAATGVQVSLVEITTHGDVSGAPLAQIGGAGVFVSALRDALHAGRIDLAVHSLKDLPTAAAPGLLVAAVPPREDPRDVLCARDGLTLADCRRAPGSAREPTGGLLNCWPWVSGWRWFRSAATSIPGWLGSPTVRLTASYSRAGLARLGQLDEATEVLDLQMLPAPGQGALAVECRTSGDAHDLLGILDDP